MGGACSITPHQHPDNPHTDSGVKIPIKRPKLALHFKNRYFFRMFNDISHIKPPSTIHLTGICGTGMGALAGLLKQAGYTVTGSDAGAYPPMSDELKRLKIPLFEGYTADNLSHNPDLVVIGNVCRADHVEAVAAREKGLTCASFPQTLSQLFLNSRAPYVVAGTHGKTTTTSLLAFLLDKCGAAPSVLVGGITQDFGAGYKLGDGVPFVVEGDEYDSAYFEKRAKFLSYAPHCAILTSVEHDHIDIYPDRDSYFDAFRSFAELVHPGPLAVYSGDAGCREILETAHVTANVITYGVVNDPFLFEPAWLAKPGGPNQFSLQIEGIHHGTWTTPLAGAHNLRNTLAALILAHRGAGIPIKDLKNALPLFGGIARRQQIVGTPNNITIYDDFAHHPTAVKVTLEALRDKHPKSRIIAAFEPRSATACRKLHQEQYSHSFGEANLALIAPVGRSLPANEALDTAMLADALNRNGVRAIAPTSLEHLQALVEKEVVPGDVVVLFSNGAFGGLHQKLVSALASDKYVEDSH
ncbi:MAG: hypothetical protein JXX14_23165 [Deltaproteobacteria bacterium]|nr:hypothetical protein [Deltaproteobacteria bacterium]